VSVKLSMDVHVRRALTVGLRLRRVDVMTAQEDGTERLSNAALLDRVTELGRVLFSQDADLAHRAIFQTFGCSSDIARLSVC
jgi:hypothetical protein